MNKEYFTDNLRIETIAEITDEILKFEKNNKTTDIKASFFKVIPAVSAILLIIGLINILPIFYSFNITAPGNGEPTEILPAITSNSVDFTAAETDDDDNANRKQYLSSYAELKNINPDFYGWIRMNYTKEKSNEGIPSYPLVHITNNEYYLNHSFNSDLNIGEKNSENSRNDTCMLDNRNTIIYGQSMINGTMFSILEEYANNEDYFKDGIIEILTENYIYCYDVFSVRYEPIPKQIKNTLLTDNALFTEDEVNIEFASDKEYLEYLYKIKSNIVFHKNIEFNENSQIITLATAVHNVTPAKRIVVQGVLIDIINIE